MKITLEIEKTGNVTAVFSGKGSAKVIDLFGTARVASPFTFAGVVEVEQHGAEILRFLRASNTDATVEWSTARCEQFVAFKYGQAGR